MTMLRWAEAIVEVFSDRIRKCGGDPRRGVYFLPNDLVREWFFLATNERLPANKVTTRLKTFGIARLRPGSGKDRNGHGCRGWWWTGEEAKPGAKAKMLPDTP